MIVVRPRWDLLPRDAESVVAVSGGPDSTALLVAAAPRRQIVAAHFNHALRGAEADADAAFVAELAARLGVPFVSEKADPPAGPDENRARDARYAFLLRVARARGCPVVAVAHTADDQAETFLMRLIRGSGTRGLGAMGPSRPLDPASAGAGSVPTGAGVRAAGSDAAGGDIDQVDDVDDVDDPDEMDAMDAMDDTPDIDDVRDERLAGTGRVADRVAALVPTTSHRSSDSAAWPSGSGLASARAQVPVPGTAPGRPQAPAQQTSAPARVPDPVSRLAANSVSGAVAGHSASSARLGARLGASAAAPTAAAPGPVSGPAPVLLVRPFLTVTRAEVLAYLKRKRVGYRIDPSNFDTTRLRARIRAELLPQLRTYNPRIVEVLCRTAAHLREDQQALESLRTAGVPGAVGGP